METRMYDIVIKNASFLNEEMRIEKNKTIAIKDGVIEKIADSPSLDAKERVDGDGLLWMPGLTDGHTHTSQQFLRGRLLDEKPVIWKRINVPFESKLDEEMSRLSAEVSALEMIKSGTTAFVDAGGKFAGTFAGVYEKSGLRGAMTYMTTDSPGAPQALRNDPEKALARLIDLHKEISSRDGRMQVYFSATALTACSKELIHAVFSEAKKRNIPVEVHMNEYASEVFDFIERYGVRPFEYLENEGLLSGKFVAPHCIFLSQHEMEIIKRHDVRVVHCPFSNCGKGIPDTPQLLSRGVSVSFGSDGSAHGGMDLFKEMRLFRGVMNAHHGVNSADPQIMPAETLLKMATQNGARAMMNENGGRIKEGCPADLIAIDIDQPHIFPTQNLVHTLVESVCGNDVAHMIVDGTFLMKNRQVLTLDEEQIMSEAKEKLKHFLA